MAITTTITLLVLAGSFMFYKLAQWYNNYQKAAKAGWPVYASPVRFADPLWMMTAPLIVPILKLLPKQWTEPWLSVSQMFEIWKQGHQPFTIAGSETFIVATPSGNVLWTSDATVIRQLLTDNTRCHIALELVKVFDVCGPNLETTEGEEWKTHRRFVAAGFGHSLEPKVWRESIDQTENLVTQWIGKENGIVKAMADWSSRLSLHVLTCGIFDLKLSWEETPEQLPLMVDSSKSLKTDHKVSFSHALITTLRSLPMIILAPGWLLELIPSKLPRQAGVAFRELKLYLDEMSKLTNSHVDELVAKKNKTFLETIVVAGADPAISQSSVVLSQDSVRGNLFFALLAGHHTTGSLIGFVFILCAVYPDVQRRLQEELDQQFGSRTKSEWSIEMDFKTLLDGYLGAIQKEVMALYHPVQFLPRIAAKDMAVRDASDKCHVIPAGTLTLPDLAAAYQSPAMRSEKPRIDITNSPQRVKLARSPALYFNPERWLSTSQNGKTDTQATNNHDDDKPSTFAFGIGPRSCLGRTFAQVEMIAVAATLFKDYSLELFVSDKTLRQCGGDAGLARRKTQEHAIEMLYHDIEYSIVLMLKHDLPIKVVPRTQR